MPQIRKLDRNVPDNCTTAHHAARFFALEKAVRAAVEDSTFDTYFSNSAWTEERGSVTDLTAEEFAGFVGQAARDAALVAFRQTEPTHG